MRASQFSLADSVKRPNPTGFPQPFHGQPAARLGNSTAGLRHPYRTATALGSACRNRGDKGLPFGVPVLFPTVGGQVSTHVLLTVSITFAPLYDRIQARADPGTQAASFSF